MAGDGLLTDAIHIHPVLILGVGILLVAMGAIFAETLFAAIAGITGVSVLVGASIWTILALITIVLGFFRSVEVSNDAQ